MASEVREIFRSVQGEGPWAGVRQVFVRFHDCNMRCEWCDTPVAGAEGPGLVLGDMDPEEIFREVLALWENCHSVSLTGGEPLLQKETIQWLLPRFREAEIPVYLDSNGILYRELAEVIAGVDFIAMDIKLPSSTGGRPYWEEHEAFLRTAVQKGRERVFIKAVISNKTVQDDLARAVELIGRVDVKVMLVLQPNTAELERGVVARCLQFQQYCAHDLADVRVLPQWHHLVGVR